MCLCCTRFDGVDVFILILTFMATVLILPVGLRSLDDCIVKYFMQPILISGLSSIMLIFYIFYVTCYRTRGVGLTWVLLNVTVLVISARFSADAGYMEECEIILDSSALTSLVPIFYGLNIFLYILHIPVEMEEGGVVYKNINMSNKTNNPDSNDVSRKNNLSFFATINPKQLKM